VQGFSLALDGKVVHQRNSEEDQLDEGIAVAAVELKMS
jgi:hypothetical protein